MYYPTCDCKCNTVFDLIETDDENYDVIDIIAYPCIIIVDLIGNDDVIDIIEYHCIIIITVMNLILLFFLICWRVCDILYD